MNEHAPRWQGRWIWTAGSGSAKNVYVMFRRDFELRDLPNDPEVRITASSRYRLWINGKYLGEGPPKSQPFLTYYDSRVLPADLLERGDNVICVLVNHVGYDELSRGGLLAELCTEHGDPILATDESWNVKQSDAWRQDSFFNGFNRVVPYQEHFDARRFDSGWLAPRYNDAAWSSATVVQSGGIRTQRMTRPPQVRPWSRLVARDIPFMREVISRTREVVYIGEVTAAVNRMRSADLSISLSQPLRELELATVENSEGLLTEDASTALACSTQHRTDPTSGIREPGLVLDFGRGINAWLELDVEGPPGATIELGYAERLMDGEFNNAIEAQFADSVTLSSRRITWRAFGWKGFRYVKIRVHGAFSPVVIHDLRAVETQYPFEESGSFTSDDGELESVWKICRSTVALGCNEYITDTPWREQGQWLGDVAAVTLGCIYACYGETALARKFLVQSGATQYPTGFLANMTNTYSSDWTGVLTDFSLWWLMALRDYYRYTGETAIVHELYATAMKLVEALLAYTNHAGLVEDMPYNLFIDWAPVETHGASSAYNAILAGGLDAMAELAGVRGDQWMVERARGAGEKIRESFAAHFWDADEALFVDSVDAEEPSGEFSEHANAAAIEFGLADEAQSRAIIDRLWARGDHFLAGTNNGVTEATPYFSSVILKALSRAQRTDLAIQLIRDRWGRRMLDTGSTSTNEEWSVHGSWRNGGEFLPIMRTLSHAWSAFPARWLPEYLAGVCILDPGCSRLSVRPAQTEFDWKSRFPTPHGIVTVASAGGSITVEAPESITIER